MAKRFISKKDLDRVKELDLLTYLQNYEPQELVKKGRNDYVTQTHGSLHISNGLWCWWAKGIGGKTFRLAQHGILQSGARAQQEDQHQNAPEDAEAGEEAPRLVAGDGDPYLDPSVSINQ